MSGINQFDDTIGIIVNQQIGGKLGNFITLELSFSVVLRAGVALNGLVYINVGASFQVMNNR